MPVIIAIVIQLTSVVQSQPKCLCTLLNGGGGGGSLGITINQTLALSLPGACNVQTPPVSQCNAANNGPTTSPPSDSAAADTPNSATDIPSIPGGTSKTIPTAAASINKMQLQSTFFILFIASTGSYFF
ncbi:non-specific lipid transfer protein GPI-anchored 5-like isoform X2 [Euphorbia lathyris]|uniref:non-specific lipid transfer protein GPI-anchored 5-like isoform X2 n=1 Tax=Euphorbia lathyris TaxID=212925 RepID=UPI0033144F18